MKTSLFVIALLVGSVAFPQARQNAREYYKQLYATGAITDRAAPNPYVCFPDDNKDWPDMFFVFKAYASASNNQQEHIREMEKEPYVTFIDADLAKLLVSPEAQKLLLQGDRYMEVQTYSKGVLTLTTMYYWDKDISRWETHDRFPTGKNVTSTMQLLIEPTTLRYARFMHATQMGDNIDGSNGSGTVILDADSGICEGPIKEKKH